MKYSNSSIYNYCTILSFIFLFGNLYANETYKFNSDLFLKEFQNNSMDSQVKCFKKLKNMTAKQKEEVSNKIVNEKTEIFGKLLFLMDFDRIFNIGIEKIQDPTLNEKSLNSISSTMVSIYPSKKISNEQRKKYIDLIKENLKNPNDPTRQTLAVNDIKSLKLKEFSKDLAKLLKNGKSDFKQRLSIIRTLKKLEYKELNQVIKEERDKVILSGNLDRMNSFAIWLKDKPIKIVITIKELESKDDETRLEAVTELRKLTGKNFGYNPIGKEEERKKAIKNWKDWYGTKFIQ